MAVCAAVAEVLNGSHATLDALFEAAGAPGPPPNLSHDAKWKTWLFRAGNDPNVDSLALVGNLIEEFMDLPPISARGTAADVLGIDHDPVAEYNQRRERLKKVLEEHGFRYFRGGRVLPNGEAPPAPAQGNQRAATVAGPKKPSAIEELVLTLVRGLPRAIVSLDPMPPM